MTWSDNHCNGRIINDIEFIDGFRSYPFLFADLDSNLTLFYECHFAPCIKTEREMRQFDVCARCQIVRYVIVTRYEL